jgi:hypothetical protein
MINIDVQPRKTADEIVNLCLKTLVNLSFEFIPPYYSANRVIFWFQIFTFGNTPTIIINVTEKNTNEEATSLTGAIRTLVDKYKLRVIIYGSPNTLDESLLNTERAIIYNIQPMSKEMIWRLSQLQNFFDIIDKVENLEEIVWAVLGGIPSKYEKMWIMFKQRFDYSKDSKQWIGDFLCSDISSAIKLVDDSKTNLNMLEIFKMFDKANNGIILNNFLTTTNKFDRLTLDKIFHEVEIDGVFNLVPASHAIGLVLRHDLKKKPSIEALEKLVLKELENKNK